VGYKKGQKLRGRPRLIRPTGFRYPMKNLDVWWASLSLDQKNEVFSYVLPLELSVPVVRLPTIVHLPTNSPAGFQQAEED
jgi:hypothetical protein